MRPKAIVSWSTGKDSAFALHRTREQGKLEIAGLLSTVTEGFARVSMHGVREQLLDAQAMALNLPCRKVEIPSPCSNATYEERLAKALETARAQGITHVVFGDLFLEDIRAYREAQLTRLGLQGDFPLWRSDTALLADEMIRSGLRAILTCVDRQKLDSSFAGRAFDHKFLRELPSGVDPCGENGEFHTFAHDGPMFGAAIPVSVGQTVEREGFLFTDPLPALQDGQSKA